MKIDQLVILAFQSVSQAATTFTGQNYGAGRMERVRRGAAEAIRLVLEFCVVIAVVLWIFADGIASVFTRDPEVIRYSTLFVHTNILFLLICACYNQMVGVLRGLGDSRTPMYLVLTGLVAVRQLYLFIGTKFIDSVYFVSLSYPIAWLSTGLLVGVYFARKMKEMKNGEMKEKSA